MPPGDYVFHTESGAIDRILNYTLEKNGVYFFRVDFEKGLWTDSYWIRPVNKDQAIRQLSSMHWNGSELYWQLL